MAPSASEWKSAGEAVCAVAPFSDLSQPLLGELDKIGRLHRARDMMVILANPKVKGRLAGFLWQVS